MPIAPSTVPAAIAGNTGIYFNMDPIVDDVASGTPVGYDGNVKSVGPSTADKDSGDLTFLEVQNGDTVDFSLVVKMIVSTAEGSLWRELWDNPAGSWALVYGPNGNAVPTADKPHFSMTVKAQGKPGFTQDAKKDPTRTDTDYTLKVVGDITLIEA